MFGSDGTSSAASEYDASDPSGASRITGFGDI